MRFKTVGAIWLFLIGSTLAWPMAQSANAQMFFGGYGYQTYFSDIGTEFPYVSSILSGEESARFERLLYDKLPTQTASGTPILKQGLATLSEAPLVFGLVFTSETVHIETISDSHKLLVILNAQLLVFDFNRSEIVASFPISARFIDVLAAPPTDRDVSALMRLALSSTSETSISTQFLKKVRTSKAPNTSTRMIRVTDVHVPEDAMNRLGKSSNPEAFKRRLADEFSAKLSTNQGIAVLPANMSQAINNSMAATMSNGTVYNISIPDTDYSIDISLDGLKKVEYATTNVGTTYIYGAFATFKFLEPYSGNVFFDEQLKLGQPLSVPKTVIIDGDSLAYAETIDKLFDEFTREIGKQNKQWAKAHINSAKSPQDSMKKLTELIEACR